MLRRKSVKLSKYRFKKEMKWTPLKIILFLIFIAVPYTFVLYVALQISSVFAGLWIGIPLFVFSILFWLAKKFPDKP